MPRAAEKKIQQLFFVDPKLIDVVEDRNVRIMGDVVSEHIAELVDSMNTFGFLPAFPISVVKNGGDRYELIHGECRLSACKKSKVDKVICHIEKDLSYEDVLITNITHNGGQRPLTPIELATAFKQLLDADPKKWTIKSIAKSIAKSQGYVRDKLVLLQGDTSVKEALNAGAIKETMAKKIIKKAGDRKDIQKVLVDAAKKSKTSKKAVDQVLDTNGRKTANEYKLEIKRMAARIEELEKKVETMTTDNGEVDAELVSIKMARVAQKMWQDNTSVLSLDNVYYYAQLVALSEVSGVPIDREIRTKFSGFYEKHINLS